MDLTPDRAVRIKNFKRLLRTKGRDIAEREMSKIPDRSINQDVADDMVCEQARIDDLYGDVLEMLIGSIVHVSSKDMLSDLKKMSTRVLDELHKYSDHRFYVVLGGTGFTSVDEGCYYKSTMFIATMLIALNPSLAIFFVDFICDSKPIHTELDATVLHYFYIDDASFSGTQVVQNTRKVYDLIPTPDLTKNEKKKNIHLVVMYTRPETLLRINMHTEYITNDKAIDLHWYTSRTCQIPIKDHLHEFIANRPGVDLDRVFSISEKMLRRPYDSDSHVLDISMFYTDLKIADNLSTYPMFLLDPRVMVDKDSGMAMKKPLVKNCPLERDEQAVSKINKGNFCPIPVYKQGPWKDFVKSTMVDELNV